MSAWVIRRNPNPSARLRLFCFPHAGGGALAFRDWPLHLPSDIEPLVVQPPGREERIGEAALARLDLLADSIAAELEPYLTIPFAFFGHSFGALLAFETARQLRRCKRPEPVHLIVSGRRAPTCRPKSRLLHRLSDVELRDYLRDLGGTPKEVLDNPDFMRLILPTLRADISACETHRHIAEEPLRCSLHVFGGSNDPDVSPSDLENWQTETSGPFAVRLFAGGHFYLQKCPEFFSALTEVLATDTAWRAPPADLVLRPGEIHVWQARLELVRPVLDDLAETLSSDERERADRFIRTANRDQFLAAHGALRSILGRYLGRSPTQVTFALAPSGKPQLVREPGSPPLCFNLSHSADMALVALALDNEVGVDVERLRPMPDALGIAEAYFAPEEAAALRQLTGASREEAFFRCWTRKEASLKARGGGISLGLDRLAGADGWWLADLPTPKPYLGACAARNAPARFVLWNWEPY